jgi:hypothetical protein
LRWSGGSSLVDLVEETGADLLGFLWPPAICAPVGRSSAGAMGASLRDVLVRARPRVVVTFEWLNHIGV